MDNFNNQNPFCNGKNRYKQLAFRWYNRLFELALSVHKWGGELFEAPLSTCNADYFNAVLLTRGYGAILKDNEGKIRSLDCAVIGRDPYGYPTKVKVANAVLSNIERTNHVDCVIVAANKLWKPAISTISYYAEQLARLQMSMIVNLDNTKMAHIFPVNNDPEAQAVRKMVENVANGDPAVIIKNSVFEDLIGKTGTLPVYSSGTEYIADRIIDDIREITHDFLIEMGINCSGANEEKPERNLFDEVHSNDQEIMVNREYWAYPRRRACEQIQRMWNIECTFSFTGEEADGIEFNSNNRDARDLLQRQVRP